MLSGPEALFNVTIGGIQLPQYSYLPQFLKVGQGNFRVYIHPENSEVLIDQFSGQSEPFVVVGQLFSGQSSCKVHSSKELRLVGLDNGKTYSGRLEIFMKGTWGTVGGNGRAFSNEEAIVACGQLGMTGGLALSDTSNYATKDLEQPQWIYDVRCTGISNAEKLTDCATNWIVNGRGDHNFDVSIQCGSSVTKHLDPVTKFTKPYRLAGDTNRNRGRAEMFKDGKWHSICGEDWDLRDAEVLCRSLGFSGAISATSGGSHFSPGIGAPWPIRIMCEGNEGSLDECEQNSTLSYQKHCSHNNIAGAVCSSFRHQCTKESVHKGYDYKCVIPEDPNDVSFNSEVYTDSELGRFRSLETGKHRNAQSPDYREYKNYYTNAGSITVDTAGWAGSTKVQGYRSGDSIYRAWKPLSTRK